MTGRIRHTVSPGFDAFVKQEIENKNTKYYIIDLQNAQYIDSTNLGILARIAKHTLSAYNNKPTIISGNKEVNTILLSMRFDKIFDIVDKWHSLPQKFNDTAEFDKDAREPRKFILDSHKELINLDTEDKQQFENIVKAIEKNSK